MKMTYYLYIIKSKEWDTFYCGSSENPERRLRYHNSESKGFTQRFRPWKLVYSHPFSSKKKALQAEQIVKDWKSKKMMSLKTANSQ